MKATLCIAIPDLILSGETLDSYWTKNIDSPNFFLSNPRSGLGLGDDVEVVFSETDLRIDRAKIEFIGAEGLRPGKLPGYSQPTGPGATFRVRMSGPFRHVIISLPKYGVWEDVNHTFPAYDPNPLSNVWLEEMTDPLICQGDHVLITYDGRNIQDVYKNTNVTALIFLEVTAADRKMN